MFHFICENLWPTVACLAGMQFPGLNFTGFDVGKLSVMVFLINIFVT